VAGVEEGGQGLSREGGREGGRERGVGVDDEEGEEEEGNGFLADGLP